MGGQPIGFYLVTGFLGSGKTTFIKQFLQWLQPRRIRLVINEYGKAGVDGELVKTLGAAVREISNGSIFCSCRLDHFEAALEDALEDAPDVMVVEASGLSDPTSIRRILRDARFAGRFDYKGCICIVDPLRLEKVLGTTRVAAKQLLVSDLVLVNKCDRASAVQIERSVEIVREHRPGVRVETTSFGRAEPAWLEDLGTAAMSIDEGIKSRDITLQKAAVHISAQMPPARLRYFLAAFADETYRIKGFVVLDEGTYLVDCVGADIQMEPWEGAVPPDANTVVALAGKGMALRKTLRAAAESYAQWVTVE